MWECHKCGKPVYFAERKQSLGYDWHPECLRCEECGKRLNPGQHAEHKGIPYCHVPCYGALFGPQLFGHGTRVESHKSYGQKGTPKTSGNISTNNLETKIKLYNKFFNNKSMEIRSREVNNRLILEGALRVYWGVHGVIHLKEDVDQRPVVVVRKRNSCRIGNDDEEGNDAETSDRENDESESGLESTTTSALDGYSTDISMSESMAFDSSIAEDTVAEISSNEDENSPNKIAATLPSKFDTMNAEKEYLDELLQVERNLDSVNKGYQTMPSPSQSSLSETSKLNSKQNSIESTDSDSKSSSKYDSIENDILDSKTSTKYDSIENINESASSNQLGTNTFSEGTEDDSTLKPLDFEDFKKSMYLEYANGSKEMLNNDSLKANQPIDPSRINDSLKLYNNTTDMMSKSFNCEAALRSINSQYPNELLNGRRVSEDLYALKSYAVQKSASTSSKNTAIYENPTRYEKGLVHSKSDHNCFSFLDSEEETTLRPSTVKRNDAKFISINMNCYNQNKQADILNKSLEKSTNNTVTDAYEDPNSLSDGKPYITEDGVQLRRKFKTGSTAIKRRSGNKRTRIKLKRRCSINGHFYNRETSFFTPPYGSQMSVWVTSLVNSLEVINLLLEKYKVDSQAQNFALFIVKDNGEQRKLKDDEYPLIVQVMLGPHEDVSRIFLMDSKQTQEISNEVAQFINLSVPECQAILSRYSLEQEKEVVKIKNKYEEMRRRIVHRMETLKVRL
ncbi:uncharacterized protein LOC129609599 [Condylostylus longicornis]|uniref:uncharacterized protein LOC129609599 n=1 Tax=Condylostylus longicornis TaxID=2530218 RepID=UPI00244DC5D2|nr:uncharacterized protein LOC129609599 [Condylostylus longicornis]